MCRFDAMENKKVNMDFESDENKASNAKSNFYLEGDGWNLSWYECCIAFEDKKRKNMPLPEITTSGVVNGTISVNGKVKCNKNENILVPIGVLKQLAIVKLQMTEYTTVMDKLDNIRIENKKFSLELQTLTKRDNEFRTKITKQREKLKRLNALYADEKGKSEKLTKKISIMKRNREIRKHLMESELKELNELRELHKSKEGSCSESSPASNRKMFDAFTSSSSNSTGYLDDEISIEEDSSSRRRGLLKSLIKNLRTEDSYISDDDDGSIASKDNSISTSASYKIYREKSSETKGFFSFFSNVEDEDDDNATI